MKAPDFSTRIVVEQSPQQVFDAILNVRGWWSEDIEGNTDKLNESFDYHFQDIHRAKIKVTELAPGKKVVWLVEENFFEFTQDKTEWTGTSILFEITRQGNKTQLVLTHQGLVPEYECYTVCRDAWTDFIQKSLFGLITTGLGNPNPKDGVNTINAENVKKWDLNKV